MKVSCLVLCSIASPLANSRVVNLSKYTQLTRLFFPLVSNFYLWLNSRLNQVSHRDNILIINIFVGGLYNLIFVIIVKV